MAEESYTLDPSVLPDVLQAPEFTALPYDQRQKVLEYNIQGAHNYVQQNGGWTPDTWKQFGELTTGLRQKVTDSESLGEKAAYAGRVITKALGDTAAIAVVNMMGASPVLQTGETQVPMQTTGPALGANVMRGVEAIRQNLNSDKRLPLESALGELKAQIDNGDFLSDPRTWLEKRNQALNEIQGEWYGEKDNSPDTWRQQNDLLANPENASLLGSYLRTRDPAVWKQLEERLYKTPQQARLDYQRGQLQSETALGRALKPDAQPLISEAADPFEMAGAFYAAIKGAKALQRGAKASERAKDIAKGVAGEMIGEQGSLTLDQPLADYETRKQVAKDTLLAALALEGVGAGVQAVNNATAAPQDLILPQPTGVGQPMSDPGGVAAESTGDLTLAEAEAATAQAGPLAGIASRAGRQEVPSSKVQVPGFQDPGMGAPIADAAFDVRRDFGIRQPVNPPADNSLADPGQPAGDVITDLRIPRSPEAIAKSQRIEQERLAQQAKLRSLETKAGRGPVIPDSPLGVYDILDFVNENRIRLPKAGEKSTGGENDWAERFSIPAYYRQFLGNTERGGSIDQVAQAAFENGFIREPTPDALMSAVQEGIATRKQYRVELVRQQKDQALAANRALDFEKTQGKLRSKNEQRVDFESLVPGDQLKIDGEDVKVGRIEYDEDGYLTNVILEDGKRFGVMQFDPQTRRGIFVEDITPAPKQPDGEAIFNPANRLGRVLADLMPPRAGGSAASSATPAAAGRAGNRQEVGGDAALRTAYQTASAGQSTAFVPLAQVFAAAQQAQPGLTREAFAQQIREAYDAGTVMLEGANSQPEAQASGFAIEGTPVGTAVRLAIPQTSVPGSRFSVSGSTENSQQGTENAGLALQNPASGGTGAGMASDSGAAQANEPSPGGLTEAEVRKGGAFTLFHRGPVGFSFEAPMFFATQDIGSSYGAELKQAVVTINAPASDGDVIKAASGLGMRKRGLKAYEYFSPNLMDSPFTERDVERLIQALEREGFDGAVVKDSDVPFSVIPFTTSQITPESARASGGTSPLASPAELAAVQSQNEAALKALGLPTKKGTRVWAGKMVKKALARIAADPKQPAVMRRMAGLLTETDLSNLLLRIESDARLRYAGMYQPMAGSRGEIALNTRAMGRGVESGAGDIVMSLVHEALHHATYRNLRSPKNAIQKQAKEDLEALRKRARAALAANEELAQFDYELSNEDEFISGLFTRADFQAALAKIPAEAAPKSLGQRVRSVLDEIFRTLGELVSGRKVEPGSVLDASFAAALRLIEVSGSKSQVSSSVQASDSAGVGQDSAAGLFRYEPRDESSLDAGERDALQAVRAAYPGERIEPLRLQDLQSSPDGPRRGQVRRDSLAEWSGIFRRVFGKRVLFIDGPARLNGASASGQRNVLVVNANSREPLLYVLGHELTHAIKTQRPQIYAELEREILLSGDDLEAYRDKLRQLKYAEGELNTELVADFIGSQMLEPAFLNRLSAANPPLFERFAQEVVKFLNSLLSKVSKLNRDVRPYFEQKIEPLRDRLAAVLNDYAATGVFPDNPLNDSGDVNLSALHNPAAGNAPNETQARFASPNPADRVIDGPRTDEIVAEEARQWLDRTDTQTAVEMFVNRAVPLPLDAQEHAAGVLISRLTEQATSQPSEVERMWAHVQGQRMARVWTREFLSADPARALRQRAVVNNTILGPIAPVLAAQEMLVDRATRAIEPRFEGGTEGAVTKIVTIIQYVDRVTGEVLSGDLRGQGDNQTRRQGDLEKKHPSLKRMLDALRKKLYPGMSWADIFMDLPDTQKARQIEIYRRLKLDERLQALTPQERLDLTNELDKAWQRERRKVFNHELQKAGVLGEKTPKDREKVVQALPKLLRLINLGMFNSEMFREAIAPEFGLRVMDAKTAAGLRQMAQAAYSMPEGVLRNRKLAELLHGMQRATGSSVAELVNSYWTAAVLSGLRTQFDTWFAAVNGMGTNLMQAGALLARGQGREAIAAHAQWWRGLREGFRESLQILGRGDYSVLKKFGSDLNEALKGESSWRPVPLGESLWRNGNAFQKWFMAPVMMWTGRLMAAADHINNTATTAGAMAVARAMHPELYGGRGAFTPQERADARAQALREVTGGVEPTTAADRATVSVRTREILYGAVNEEQRQASSDIGDVAAYQNDPTGVFDTPYQVVKGGLGTVTRALDAKAQDVEAQKITRALAAVLSGSLHGLTGTRFVRFGFNFGADMTRYVPGTAFFKDLYGSKMSRMEQDLLVGKNVVGLMIASTLAALFLNGDDEDEGWQIEGDWSTLTPQQAKERMSAGLERLTMWKRENGQVRRVSYKQWPTMALFATVGAMLDERRHKPEQWAQRGTAGHLLRAAGTGVLQVKNVTAIRGLVELFGEPGFATDKTQAQGEAIVRVGSNFVGGFVPTLMKDADAWNDPRNFRPEGVMESLMRSMPIARRFVNDGRPQLNLLGEEVKLQRAPWSRAYSSVESAEAHRVLGALLSRGLSLPQPSDQVSVFQDGLKLPLEKLGREKVWRYERAVGMAYRAWLASESTQLLQMPVKEADRVIETRAKAIKRTALAQVMGR